MFNSKAIIPIQVIFGHIDKTMKLNKFNQFITESAGSAPAEVRLATLGLGPGLRVLEWSAKVRGEDRALLQVVMLEFDAWPEKTEDDQTIIRHFDANAPREFIEKKVMADALDWGFEWVHDLERDTWKKVNR